MSTDFGHRHWSYGEPPGPPPPPPPPPPSILRTGINARPVPSRWAMIKHYTGRVLGVVLTVALVVSVTGCVGGCMFAVANVQAKREQQVVEDRAAIRAALEQIARHQIEAGR